MGTGVVIYITKCMMWRLLCYIILKSRLKVCGALKTSISGFWTTGFLERLQSIFCISFVTKSFTTKRFTLPHRTDESKSLALAGEINLGFLIHPLLVECRSN